MTTFTDLRALYDNGSKEEHIGNHKNAKNIYSQVIDGCQRLLTGETGPDQDVSVTLTGAPAGSAGGTGIPSAETDINKLMALSYNNRGYIRYLEVDFEVAVEDYSEALKYDKALYVAYYNRGLIHYRLGRFEAAIQDQMEALRGKPDFQSAKTCMEQSQAEMNKIQNS